MGRQRHDYRRADHRCRPAGGALRVGQSRRDALRRGPRPSPRGHDCSIPAGPRACWCFPTVRAGRRCGRSAWATASAMSQRSPSTATGGWRSIPSATGSSSARPTARASSCSTVTAAPNSVGSRTPTCAVPTSPQATSSSPRRSAANSCSTTSTPSSRSGRYGGSLGFIQELYGTSDGSMIAVRGGDRRVVLYDVATGVRIGQPMVIPDDESNLLAFSIDGSTLAIGGGTDAGIKVWDLNPGTGSTPPARWPAATSPARSGRPTSAISPSTARPAPSFPSKRSTRYRRGTTCLGGDPQSGAPLSTRSPPACSPCRTVGCPILGRRVWCRL